MFFLFTISVKNCIIYIVENNKKVSLGDDFMFNKKKGFTLVEVLAILVILAIIALIAVPSILKITTESKINSIESSAQMLAKAAEDYYSSQIIGGTELEKVNLADETIIYRGTKPTMGYAYFDEEGRAYIKMYYDGYCVIRNYTGELELQETEPTDCSIADMVSIVLYYDGGQINANDKWSINDNYASTVLDFANALTEIPTITRPGYTFLGWWDEENKQVNLAAPVTKNIKATAKWQANTYTITLDTTGGIVDGGYESTREIVFNTEYGELPEPTKFGYIFQGWYTAGGLRVEADTILTNPSNHTIYATWEAIKYTVTLNSNGGVFTPQTDWTINGSIASRVTIHGTYYNDLLTPTNTGYTFNGWYTEGGIKVDSSVMVEGELSLYAKWTPNNYVITFKYNDGVTADTTKDVTYDSAYGTLPNPTRAGYTFTGWLSSGGSLITKDTIVKVTSNTDLYAQWSVNTYTLTFKYNDNKTSDTEKTVTYDKTYGTLPSPSRDGYTFLGWYTALTSGTKIEASQTVKTAKDQILYAIWSQNTYTITFNSSGGTIPSGTNWTGSGTTATKQVVYDNTYGELPNPSKTGYTFNGWATSGGDVIDASDTVEIIASTTLYAQWGANSYLVTFDANGGEVTIQNSSIEFNKTYGSKVGELPTPTRTGYTFQGWYSAKTSGTVVTKDSIMNTASNHSIYARWTANTYTVTFNRTNFGNGEVVYFNPNTAQVCDSSEAVSTTGYKDGCMKWYAFLDDGSDTIKLLLDHNTTAFIAYNNDVTKTTPDTINTQLHLDVANWNTTVKNSARLISAQEVNQIAPTNSQWDINVKGAYYNFHTGTKVHFTGTQGANSFGWLFNNTGSCLNYGCNNEQNDTWGYWTSSYNTQDEEGNYAWRVHYYGSLQCDIVTDNDSAGVRPVIEINKSLLKTTKEVTYDNTYGTLPILTKPGYEFTGWYTTGGTKIQDNGIVGITNNIEVYPQWIKNKYIVTLDGHKYENGTPIYFNPVTGQKCTISDYTESQSATGVKTGCMKWYTFLDSKDSSTVNLILDHNTTGMVAWNSNSSGTTPDTINAQLQTDVSNWNTNIKSTARLISASEINQIAPKNGTWNKNDYNTWYYLYDGSTTQYTGVAGSNTYGWLFDNTATCTTYGCHKYDTGTNGYWTSDFASSGNAWCINYGGVLFYGGVIYDYIVGVRPVITVSKSVLGTNGPTNKTVTYDSTYGELPTLTKDGYNFLGWYTTGGVKIEPETIVSIPNNQILYAQWKKIVFDFIYTGNEQIFTIPYAGTYKLEVWGAQGGCYRTDDLCLGYGGYSAGEITLNLNQKIYINVGGEGSSGHDPIDGSHVSIPGGYNGGGNGITWYDTKYTGGGGGATHIATRSGLLSSLESYKSNILIVAGGGGGTGGDTLDTNANLNYYAGSGGGYIGGTATQGNTGGTQTEAGVTNPNTSPTANGDIIEKEPGGFGYGGSNSYWNNGFSNDGNCSGGGGGYYGGSSSFGLGGYGAGGSGYIGNSNLTNKVMYCYLCQESTDLSTKTTTTSNVSYEAISKYAKIGNGYARITYLGE